jgi:protein subunit release factor B
MEKKRELLFSWRRKDFDIKYFSAGGPGGQHQNKTASACRITHIESGLSAECREHREQPANRKAAFNKLAKLLVSHYVKKSDKATHAPDVTIRNYHEPEDRVTDQFGRRYSYKEVIGKGKASKMINQHIVDARNKDAK